MEEPDQRAYAAATAWFLGLELEKEGRRDDALDVLRDAAATFGPDDGHLPLILIDLAALERDEDRFRTALGHLEHAASVLEHQREAGRAVSPWTEILLRSEEGAAYLQMGLPDLAEAPLREAHALAEETEDPWLWSGAVVFLMNLANETLDFEALRDAYAAYEAHPLRAAVDPGADHQIRLRLGFGQVLEELHGAGEPGGAEATLAAVLAEPDVKPDEAIKGRLWLATSRLDRGRHEAARRALVQTEALLRETANAPGPDDVQLATLHARLALDSGAPAEELARVLDERMLPAYDLFLRMWASSPVREGGVGYLQYGRRDRVPAELVELLVAVHGPEEGARRGLRQLLRAQALGTLARANGVPAPELAEVGAELLATDERRGVLCFLPGRNGSHAFALDADALTHHALAPSRDVEAAAQELVAAVLGALRRDGPPSRAALERARADLAALLLPDDVAARVRGWERVVVTGLDGFGYVPFELVLAGHEVGDRAVSWLPSLPVGVWLARRARAEGRPAPEGGVLVLGGDGAPPPEGDEALADLAPLRLAESDLAALAEPYAARGVAVEARLASRAAPALLESPAFEDAALVHIVAHGVYRGTHERPASLLAFPALGAAGELDAARLESLRPPVVALTACGSWRSRLRRGDDGRGHLGGALLHAGAPAVLLSYVDLELRASLDLMGRFHAHVAAGEPLDRALLLARREADPEAVGMPPVHSYLTHVLGVPEALFPPPAGDGESGATAWLWPALALGLAGAAALALRRGRDRRT